MHKGKLQMAGWKTDWDMTRAAFDKLLAQLDTDVKRAADTFIVIHKGLVKYFQYQGCPLADELADETTNRAARRVFEGAVIQAGKAGAFFRGIARLVLHEYWRSPDATEVPIDDEILPPHLAYDPNEQMRRLDERRAHERRLDCLESCVENLPPETRRLIFAYEEGGEGERIARRKRLAEEMSIPISRLRLRIHRIRKKLEDCVTDCCARAGE